MKKIGMIVGSLRQASLSKKVAGALISLFPEGHEVRLIPIGDLPVYNEDYDLTGNPPDSYTAFRSALGEMDAFVFVTPEYNRGLPAPIKNAIDVGSRPYHDIRWTNKPAAIVSISMGRVGGFGANQQLKQSLLFFNMPVMGQPEVYLSSIHEMMDEAGKPNEELSGILREFVGAFVAHVEKNQPPGV